MIGALLPLTLQSLAENPASKSGTGLGTGDFQQILTGLLLASTFSKSSASSGGLAGGDLMSPIIITLLEQMLSQQLQGQSGSAQTASTTAASSFGGSTPTPRGAPVHGPLTQEFHPGHNGLDFGVVVGTPARTTMDGEVVYAGWNDQGYGNLVIVENGPYRTYYAHLSQIPVSVGQQVRAGSVVGLTGNTGRSTGPHIHYEVRKDGTPIDPSGFTFQ